MRLLSIDIETSPLLCYSWGTFNVNIGLNQILKPTQMMCFAAKWYDSPKIIFKSTYHDGTEDMVKTVHGLLDEADAVMHYNGKRFDELHINREIIERKLGRPSPYKSIDLYQKVKRIVKLPSNKLQYVSTWLGTDGKAATGGMELWVQCLADPPSAKAWATMRTYNKQDTLLLESTYDSLLPWLDGLPHAGLYGNTVEENVCQTCGSANVQKRGFAYTNLGRYQQYRCERAGCGAWSRGKKLLDSVDLRGTS